MTHDAPLASGSMLLAAVPVTDSRVGALVEEVQAYYVEIYGGPDDSPFDPHEFEPPVGHFVLGTLDGAPVAMGGWRLRPELGAAFGSRVAEIKRMFVSPRARRRGYAAGVLAELERTAVAAGVDVLVLETGTMQPDAIALYLASGYQPTLRYGHYEWSDSSRYYARSLTGVPLPAAPPPPERGRQEP